MSNSLRELLKLTHECESCLKLINRDRTASEKSELTKVEYKKLAIKLLERAELVDGGIAQAIQKTSRSNTFYKRLASLTYYFQLQCFQLAKEGSEAKNDENFSELIPQFSILLSQLKALVTIKETGLLGVRTKRRSKRQSISGLPANWRTSICERGSKGKYALPLLIAAITGVRPKELVKGIEVSLINDIHAENQLIMFKIFGAKVNAKQGQPERTIIFSQNDENTLIKLLLEHIQPESNSKLLVQIENATNFTVEIRRLAKQLWPKHKHAISAYCFRHQWSADLKAAGDGDAVSRGLGHMSSKTRKYYGTASQSSTGDQLRPIQITAERPIKQFDISFSMKKSKTANFVFC